MISIIGRGGGSDEMKHLKSSWAPSSRTTSRLNSKSLIHSGIRCTFWNMHQWPALPASFNTLMAYFSWPYPIEILMNDPSAATLPDWRPINSTSGVGSTPGKSTKNVGVWGFISTLVATISNGWASTYSIPMWSPTNYLRALVSLSGLIALSKWHLWNREILERLFGRSQDSGFSSEYHFLHIRCSLSILLDRLLKISRDSRPLIAGQSDSYKNFNDSG